MARLRLNITSYWSKIKSHQQRSISLTDSFLVSSTKAEAILMKNHIYPPGPYNLHSLGLAFLCHDQMGIF